MHRKGRDCHEWLSTGQALIEKVTSEQTLNTSANSADIGEQPLQRS